MNEWIDELADLSAAGERVVMVTVAGIRGSAPREVGAKMLVTGDETLGTIGGGQLEYQCARIAFDMLGDDESPLLRKFPLGTSMGQCCGGVVDILFEPIASVLPSWLQDLRALHGQREPAVMVTHVSEKQRKFVLTADNEFGAAAADLGDEFLAQARAALASRRMPQHNDGWLLELVVGSDLNVAVFGAGHVGAAVVQSLSALDCNIRWVDSRRNIFRRVPANVRTVETADPALEVAAMPAGSFYLVMTHSHAIDFDVCERILRRDGCSLLRAYRFGLEAAQIREALSSAGRSDALLANLVCPIGVAGISGKKPAEIAVSATAEILQAYEKVRLGADIAYPDNVRSLKNKK